MNRKLFACAALALAVSAVRGEMMNARLGFDAQGDIVAAGKAFCLKTEVVQTGGDALVLDPTDFAALQPTGPKGVIAPSAECLSGKVLVEMKDLRFVFSLATAGDYETWIRARFPLSAGYNHIEQMDDGDPHRAWDSSVRKAADANRPEEGRFLEPKIWHWVRNYTYPLSAGRHVFSWPEPSAWCGGCELDRIVLVRRGSGLRPEDVTRANRRLVRPARAEILSRPVRLAGIRAWQLDYAVSRGGVASFDCTTDGGAHWRPVEAGRAYPVAGTDAFLRFRLTLAAGAEGEIPPIVYSHQFKIERESDGVDVKKTAMAAAALGAGLATAGIRPLRIVPNKIVYPVGERGWADVAFTNTSAQAERAAYVVTDSWDVDGSGREISRGEIEIGPRAGRTVRVDWPGSTVRYGHELRVTVDVQPSTSNIQPARSRAEYFAVNDDWWRVAQGMGLDTIREELTPLFRQFMEYYGLPVRPPRCTAAYRLWMEASAQEGYGMGPFPGYQTLLTRWQMQICSVGGNKIAADKPDGERWYSTTEVTEARDSGRIRRDGRVSREHGVHHTRYTVGFMEGPYGFELARRHPEFILRTDRGQFVGNYAGEKVDPVWISEIGTGRQGAWTYLRPDFDRDDAVEWAVRDLAAGIDGFGEDGVYWDGPYHPDIGYDCTGRLKPDPKDKAARRARVLRTDRLWYDLIVRDHPDRFAWMNRPPASARNRGVSSYVQPRSGTLLEYQWSFLLSPSHPSNTYRGMLDEMRQTRDSRYLPIEDGTKPSKVFFVGYLAPCWMPRPKNDPGQYREVWTMSQHVMSLLAATLAHPFAGGPQMRNFKQMMMRYSQFYWHEDIEVVRDGYRHFLCDSLREIWYDDTIYRREMKDCTDYYIHLVNVPESERCREDVVVDPPEVNDAVVSTKLFGAAGAKAWAIQPYAYLDPVLEPRQTSVPVRSANGETVVEVPPFRYYTLLVIRVPKR